jgi:hypothetical protein
MHMKLMQRTDVYCSGALAANESRFEQADIGPVCGKTIHAYLSRRLQKLFPLPPESTEPEKVRTLLRKIEAKLDGALTQ